MGITFDALSISMVFYDVCNVFRGKIDAYVFPFILGNSILAEIDKADEVVGELSVAIKERMKQENRKLKYE